MKCLAVNTANSIMSIALVDGDDVLYRYDTPETRDQGNLLLGHIEQALETAGISYADLGLLAVVTGPGSFTGIRIGIAAMRGIALAAKVPVCAVTSFELFSTQRQGKRNIIAIESWREELYLQLEGETPVNVSPEKFMEGLAAGDYIVSGDAREKISVGVQDDRIITAVDAARIAVAKFKAGKIEKPLPFYLREADVTLSTKMRKIGD